jgi:glycyl-tRNA synthetase beta chain
VSGPMFLLEVGTEELPHHFIAPALEHLAARLAEKLLVERLGHGAVTTAGTPRRLIVRVADLATRQDDFAIEHFGPPVSVAFQNEVPTRAAEKFAERFGRKPTELERRTQQLKGKDVACLFFREQRAGRATAGILAEALPEMLASVPGKKSMRWGYGRATFCRPVRWLVALHGEALVPFTFAGVTSGRRTSGHRFQSSGWHDLARAEDHEALLRRVGVMADPAERRKRIAETGAALAHGVGGTLVEDPELLAEVSQLVEHPYPLLGSFDPRFLELPGELLVTVMRVHQRYFPIRNAQGALTHHFVTVSGTEVRDPKVVAAGNAKVIAARFWDARFLYSEDQKSRLEDFAQRLGSIQFVQGLGTIADKAERVRQLAAWLCGRVGITGAGTTLVDRAAALCKADLSSRMVYEFPELAGTMGRYFARNQGESPELADAIAEHVLPRTAEDTLPTSLAGALVGLADRMDSLCGIFGIGETVTGAKDKYGLRRLALACLRILRDGPLPVEVSLRDFVRQAIAGVRSRISRKPEELEPLVLGFCQERLRNWLGEELPGDVCNAVVAAGCDQVRDAFARARALGRVVVEAEQQTAESPFRSLTQASKRVSNILKQAVEKEFLAAAEVEAPAPVDPAVLREGVEKTLLDAIHQTARANDKAIEQRDWDTAIRRLAALKPALDGFFGADSRSGVMVMVADNPTLRLNRLRMLASLRGLVQRVADLSQLNR